MPSKFPPTSNDTVHNSVGFSRPRILPEPNDLQPSSSARAFPIPSFFPKRAKRGASSPASLPGHATFHGLRERR
jgi:hypothetical protein